MAGGNSFLGELKRRKVVRTCAVYVLLCWGALQVGDILFPTLGLDAEASARYLLVAAVLGFPFTFALAWFFQITPHGIARTQTFVERRVLANIPPINDKRSRGLLQLLRRGEADKPYDWVLTAESGPLSGLRFAINRPLTLGRALDCDLAIVSPHVSRMHARLDLENDQLYIEDLGSANGTIVNGKTVRARQPLRNDDEVRFHDIVFRVSESYTRARPQEDTLHMTTFIQPVSSGTQSVDS